MARVLKHQYLIIDVCRGVVHGRCRNKHYLFLITRNIACFHARHLADFLQLLESTCGVIAELMSFVHQDQIIFVGIPIVVVVVIEYLREATV